MEPTIIPIPRNEGGTRAVLEAMATIARESAPLVEFLSMNLIAGSVAGIDPFLRGVWNYVFQPLPDIQELKVPDLLLTELADTGRMTGACAEAATFGAAMALHFPVRVFVCAVRPPRSIYFEHVFTMIDSADADALLVDPTAPETADYRGWETMCVSIRR